MKEILVSCFTFLQIGLILIKISAFHVYEHHDSFEDSGEHCEVCILTIDGQQSESVLTSLFLLEESSLPVFCEREINFSDLAITKATKVVFLFSRPPPSLRV